MIYGGGRLPGRLAAFLEMVLEGQHEASAKCPLDPSLPVPPHDININFKMIKLCLVPFTFLASEAKGIIQQQSHYLMGTRRNSVLAPWLCPNQLCDLTGSHSTSLDFPIYKNETVG